MNKKNSVQLKDEKEQLKIRAKALINEAKKEVRELTEEEEKEIEEIKKSIENINKDLQAIKDELEKKSEDLDKSDNKKENKSENKRSMEKRKFSVVNAINCVINNRAQSAENQAVIDAAAEQFRNAGLAYQGQIQLPVENRDITLTDEHDDLVGVEVMDVIKPLRALPILGKFRVMSGLRSDVILPVMKGNTGSTWSTENAEAGAGNTSFTSVKLQPKRLCTTLKISKSLLLQTSESVENLIRQDLVESVLDKLQSTIFGTGAGDTETPKGLFNGDLGAPIATFEDICNLEAKVENANSLINPIYVMSPAAKAKLRNIQKGKGLQNIIEDGKVDGIDVVATSSITGNNILFGNLERAGVIGQFGNLDIAVDPLSLASENMIKITINSFWDFKLVQPEAIAVGTLA